MEVILLIIAAISLFILVNEYFEHGFSRFFAVSLSILIPTIIGFVLYMNSVKTEYICPTRLTDEVGIYNDGRNTIVIPLEYDLDEVVIKHTYSELWGSLEDTYTIKYDINGVCK
jgi:hypothetical protein